MMAYIRHVFSWTFYSIVLTAIILSITFYVFPLESYELLFDLSLFDLPFLLIVAILPITFTFIVSSYSFLQTRRKIRWIEKRMNELATDEPLTRMYAFKEEKNIQKQLNVLAEKLEKQTSFTQKVATERAEEREQSLQDVVVQERNRLARELHDSVSQQLFASSMMMSAINESIDFENEQLTKQLKMVEHTIHQSQLEMRALLLHLRPVPLKGNSIQEGAEQLLQELQQKVTIDIKWKIDSFDTSKGIEDQLFRIMQEAISNTLRHAKASQLEILLISRDRFVILRISDDGVGFSLEDERVSSSYGLSNMKERTEEVSGTFKVVSLPNEGTTITIKIPQIEEGSDES
ncbi:MAG TPA: sensor histidine kinase [Bacillota bacterium]|nr:sensor histidine kinase [Bacillota bacterium]